LVLLGFIGFNWALGFIGVFCISSSTITEPYTTEVVDSGIKVLKGIRKEQKQQIIGNINIKDYNRNVKQCKILQGINLSLL